MPLFSLGRAWLAKGRSYNEVRMTTRKSAVIISNVTKQFGAVRAVNGLNLTIPEGSVYGFIGPNGSGKTTTMRMIANISRGTRGQRRPARAFLA